MYVCMYVYGTDKLSTRFGRIVKRGRCRRDILGLESSFVVCLGFLCLVRSTLYRLLAGSDGSSGRKRG